MSLDIVVEEPGWADLGIGPLAEAAVAAALAGVGLDPADCEATLLACGDARIAALNADFRGKPQPTNVLSWPAEERGVAEEGARPALPAAGRFGTIELGDMAIALETCRREAEEQGKRVEDHVTHLLVHGTLHLLGYDHLRAGDADLMEAEEVRILAELGVSDPYA